MERVELGERLQQWHSSMSDPVYAVGSFYFNNQNYPEKEVVEDCLNNLQADISKFQKMLRGEKVQQYNSFRGVMITDLRTFAGYTDQDLQNNITDLEEIVSELEKFLKQDYN